MVPWFAACSAKFRPLSPTRVTCGPVAEDVGLDEILLAALTGHGHRRVVRVDDLQPATARAAAAVSQVHMHGVGFPELRACGDGGADHFLVAVDAERRVLQTSSFILSGYNGGPCFSPLPE